jgi:hypothetical protein
VTIDYGKAIQQNLVYSSKLGWKPGEILPGAKTVDSAFVDGVAALQTVFPLPPVDGVCGPATYSVILAKRQASALPGWNSIVERGLVAMIELKRLWLRNIVDLPPIGDKRYETCRSTLAQIIQTPIGLGWSWIDIPTNTPSIHQIIQFCGSGPAYGWRAAGLKLDLRKNLFSSTFRLDCYGGYKPFDENTPNKKPATGPYRMMIELDEHSKASDAKFPDGSLPRAGDIVLVGGVATGPGKHICTAEDFDPITGKFTTLELNGGGWGPNGDRMRGVVRAQRYIGLPAGQAPTTYFVRRVIRPCVPDCT